MPGKLSYLSLLSFQTCFCTSVLCTHSIPLYCCCCRGFYCLQPFVFVCRREKISVKSNKIFSVHTFFKKTEHIMKEHLSASENLEELFDCIFYCMHVQNAFSFLSSHITTHSIANMLTVWCGKCVENDNKSQSRDCRISPSTVMAILGVISP